MLKNKSQTNPLSEIISGIKKSGNSTGNSLNPENNLKRSGHPLQRKGLDRKVISQNIIDLINRLLEHYLNGGTMANFEEKDA